MTIQVYRDQFHSDATNGSSVLYWLYQKLKENGWNDLAHGTGSGGARMTGALADETDLNSAPYAWFMLEHGSDGCRLSFRFGSNTSEWNMAFTEPTVSLTAGDATTPDHSTYTNTAIDSRQMYVTSGTVDSYSHTVIDDASPSFAMFVRRSPYVGGSAFCVMFLEKVTPLIWVDNPAPYVCGGSFDDANSVSGSLVTSGNRAWYARGLSGETWATEFLLENPSSYAGNSVRDPSGVCLELETRWVRQGGVFLLGKSELFRLLNPYIGPTTGLDEGATLNRAAFGHVSVANDGIAQPAS